MVFIQFPFALKYLKRKKRLVAYSDLSIGLNVSICLDTFGFIMTPVQEILSIQYSLASAKAAIGRINSVLD